MAIKMEEFFQKKFGKDFENVGQLVLQLVDGKIPIYNEKGEEYDLINEQKGKNEGKGYQISSGDIALTTRYKTKTGIFAEVEALFDKNRKRQEIDGHEF